MYQVYIKKAKKTQQRKWLRFKNRVADFNRKSDLSLRTTRLNEENTEAVSHFNASSTQTTQDIISEEYEGISSLSINLSVAVKADNHRRLKQIVQKLLHLLLSIIYKLNLYTNAGSNYKEQS